MKITEVRIFPTESRDGKLKAFATMTFDDWFVVRNVKVIQGNSGLFVAMPSRKATDSCPKCRFKNVRGSKYYNQCGSQIGQQPVSEEAVGEKGSHMDIAHPISQECRVYIQEQILVAYNTEKEKQQAEGGVYKPDIDKDLDVAADQTPLEEAGEPAVDVDDAKDIEL